MTHRCVLRGLMVALACAAAGACDDRRAEPAPTAPTAPATPATDDHAQHTATNEHKGHAGHVLPADAPLSGHSLYHLDASLTDQRGKALELSSFRGSPVLMTMFYASCTSICPMLISQLKRVDEALAPDVRARTKVLLVSLDPARDSVESLAALAKQHGIDDARWHFVRTEPEKVREIAALLGIRYRATPDGEISHSPTIALLDREGAIAARMENAAGDPAPLIAATARVAAVATP